MLRALHHRALVLLVLLLGSGLPLAGEDDWRAHMRVAEDAQKRGDRAAAATSYDAALREAEGFGPQDRRLAETLSRVAANHQAQGRFAEAESHYRRALAIRQATDGPDSFEVGRILNSIAVNYLRQSRLAEAEPLLERAIAIAERVAGPDHLSVATGLNSLGQLKVRQGRYAEAEPVLQRALSIREKALGPNHADVAGSVDQLADVHRAQRRFGDAERLYLRALQILESNYSRSGPLAATVQSKLYELRRMQHRAVDVTVVDSLSELNELYDRVQRGNVGAPQIAQQMAKSPSQATPEETAAAGRIWEPDRWHLTLQSANQAQARGETMEAERLCALAIHYVSERTVGRLEEYATLLGTLNRAGAQDAKARAEKLRDARGPAGPGSVYLGFDPVSELRAYATLLRELSRTLEADAVSALADADSQVQFMNFIRNMMASRGQDWRGTCSLKS